MRNAEKILSAVLFSGTVGLLVACGGGSGSSGSAGGGSSSSSSASSASSSVSYSALGGFQTAAILTLNTSTSGALASPVLTTLRDDSVVLVWADDGGAAGAAQAGIQAQKLKSDGTKIGGEFRVNTAANDFQVQPGVATLADGRFIVVYRDGASTFSAVNYDGAIKSQVFEADGTKSGAEMQVGLVSSQAAPVVTGLAGGGYAIAWSDFSFPPADVFSHVRAQVYSASGTIAGAEWQSSTGNYAGNGKLATLTDGRLVVVWHEAGVLNAQIIDANGNPVGALLALATSASATDEQVIALNDGSFIVVWAELSGSTGLDVIGQKFTATGVVGAHFVINQTTALAQSLPSVTLLTDGHMMVTWWNDSSNGTAIYNVRARLFSTDGNPLGDEFVVSDDSVAAPTSPPSITALKNGGFFVAWSDGQATAIHGRTFKP